VKRHRGAGSAGDVGHRFGEPSCELQLRRSLWQPHRRARVDRDDDAGLDFVFEGSYDELVAAVVPRGRAPVYVADIIARQVRAKLAELEALTALTNLVRTGDRSAVTLTQPQPEAIQL
jgi:hypothetical protein